MDHALILIFLIVSLVPAIEGRSLPLLKREVIAEHDRDVYGPLCPDGLPGLTTQIQHARLESQNDIYITDCSPSRHTKSSNTLETRQGAPGLLLDKRQENICPADCSVSCDGGAAGSSSDCNTLVVNLSSRGQSRTIAGYGIWQETYGTCACTFTNMNDSPIVYCDASLASRCQSVVSQCSSGVSGKCQGSRFYASVSKISNAASSPSPSPAADTPAPSQGSSGNNSNSGNGSNNNGNSSSNGNGATTANGNGNGNTGASTNASNPTASNGAASLSGSAVTAVASHVGSIIPSSTTLADGSVMTLSVSISLPSGNSESANTGSSGSSHSNNTPAIVGAIFGVIAIILLIVGFLFWRRRRKAQQQQMESDSPASLYHSQPHMLGDYATPNDSTPEMEEAARSIAFASTTKSRMAAERPRHQLHMSASSLTDSTVPRSTSPGEDSYAPPYRARSGRRSQHSDSNPSDQPSNPQRHRSQRHEASASGSETYSTITGSSGRSQRSAARTFAQAAAPNLSTTDIDRLAESIVARMQGRDPRVHERRISGTVMEEDEEEPPPPWSAPLA